MNALSALVVAQPEPRGRLRHWLFICENDDVACQISVARRLAIHRAGNMMGLPQVAVVMARRWAG